MKRRQRLIGPNGATLKALELLTGCYVMVQGNTVSVLGSFKGLKTVRRIVEDCLHNIHPIYHIKVRFRVRERARMDVLSPPCAELFSPNDQPLQALMIKRELEKDPALANENWDRFLPKFKGKTVQRKKPKVKKEKKSKSLFPPLPTPSKVDIALESGEYFLSESQKREKASEEKATKQKRVSEEKKKKRLASFVPPQENESKKSNKPEQVHCVPFIAYISVLELLIASFAFFFLSSHPVPTHSPCRFCFRTLSSPSPTHSSADEFSKRS